MLPLPERKGLSRAKHRYIPMRPSQDTMSQDWARHLIIEKPLLQLISSSYMLTLVAVLGAYEKFGPDLVVACFCSLILGTFGRYKVSNRMSV